MRTAAALLPIVLATACGGPPADRASAHEVMDSAGVQVVSNGSAGETAVLVPDLVIGTVDGPEELQFFRVTALAVDPSGSIFIGDGSSTIREFDSAGTFVRRFGRRGDGPGEFQWPNRIFRYGDTTAVSDSRHYRISMFDPAGVLLGTLSYRREASISFPVARVGGGWILQPWQFEWRDEIGRARRDTLRLVFAADEHTIATEPTSGAGHPDDSGGLNASAVRPVATYLSGRSYGIGYEMNGSAGMTANSPLWEPSPAHAVDAAGNVYLASGGPYRIDVYNADGIHWRSILRAHVPVPTTGELNERYWDKVNTWLDTTTNRSGEWPITVAASRGRADLPVNEALPALGRMIVSDEGMLWAFRPDLAPDPLLLEWTREGSRQDTHWDVFDHEGRFLLTARLPAEFRPMAAGGSSIFGVLRDDLDVEHVARFTLPASR